jgi:hypothetical protein
MNAARATVARQIAFGNPNCGKTGFQPAHR